MPSPKPSLDSRLPFASDPMAGQRTRRATWMRTLLIPTVLFVGTLSVLAAPYLPRAVFPPQIFAAPTTGRLASQDLPEAWHVAAPFVFDSVLSFLKQWPSSYAPNGHSVVVGSLPPGTVFYHAKTTPGPPKKPTFYAFDAEMSLGIYGGAGKCNLHVHTTTRTLNILYFDGQAAGLSAGGSLDSQMALLQGQVPLYPSYKLIYDEDQRKVELCDLIAELGFDGVVRMDAGFEVLVCDSTAAQVQPLFVTNYTIPGNVENENDKSLPRDPNRQPPRGFGNVFAEQGSWEWLRSASWHYGGIGSGGPSERRVKLDVCKMVSFYDPALTSLEGSHHGGIVGNHTFQNGWGLRRGHRLLDISPTDVRQVRSWLHEISSPNSKGVACSGVDWHALFTVVRAQHGTRAREIGDTLTWKHETDDEAKAIIVKVHELSHAILGPYLEYPSSRADVSATTKDQTISRCSSVYTSALDQSKLARSELLLYHSLNIVLQKLCSWEWDLFEWSEKRTTNFLGDESGPANLGVLQKEIDKYSKVAADGLEWIGWDSWAECDRLCGVDEICAIPTWPVVYAPGLPQGGIYAGNASQLSAEETFEFWRPKCINRADFDRGGGRGREPDRQLPDVPPYRH